MWCLGRLLPLMIAVDIPLHDQHWECFLLMMTIVDYVFAPVTSSDLLDYIREVIETHHHLFKELHPTSSFIPKLHYIIHIPDWIAKYFTKN